MVKNLLMGIMNFYLSKIWNKEQKEKILNAQIMFKSLHKFRILFLGC